MTRIQLCGRLEVELAGERIERRLPGRQGPLVLALLAVNRERPVTRDELIGALWPGRPPGRPRGGPERAGDDAAVARHIDEVPPRDLLARMDIQPGHQVLDVATGTGNLALRAAAAGAEVSGLDLTPELFDAARARAAAMDVVVDWVEGDAEELPYEDDAFDRVVSAFGVQFAPRHQIVAHELAGVCRPGGRIGLVNWTPEGLIGELFKIIGGFMPAPPAFASPPPLWGSPAHVRRLFEGTRVVLDFDRGTNPWRFESAEAWVAFMETAYGPTVKARQKLGADGRWAECRAEIVALAERRNEATDGSLHMEAEYLIAIGHKVG